LYRLINWNDDAPNALAEHPNLARLIQPPNAMNTKRRIHRKNRTALMIQMSAKWSNSIGRENAFEFRATVSKGLIQLVPCELHLGDFRF
jgi:hypothetical protein